MDFSVILDVTPTGRVAKIQEFGTRQEADTHADAHPGSFVVPNPPGRHFSEWVINSSNKRVSFSPPEGPAHVEPEAIQAFRAVLDDPALAPATKAAALAILGPAP